MKKLYALLWLASFFIGVIQAQQPVTSVTTSTQSATPSTVGSETWGNGNDIFLETITIGANTYDVVLPNGSYTFERVDNANSSGDRCRIFSERIGGTGSTTYRPTFPVDGSGNCSMETALREPIINRGALDVFHNVNSGSQNANNIERVDLILNTPIEVPNDFTQLAEVGFLATEKNGNNEYKAAVVKSLDVNGKPASYGPLAYIDGTNADYGEPNPFYDWRFIENAANPPHGLPQGYGAFSERIGYTLLTWQDLGIVAGDIIYGVSYFGKDVVAGTHDLTDPTTFPQNTNEGADIHGGLGAIAAQATVDLPPVALDDFASTLQGIAVTVDVLANDDDAIGMIDPTSVTTAGLLQPSNGTTSIDPVTGEITYTPNPGFSGTDTFEYSVCDDSSPAQCDVALVTITVIPDTDLDGYSNFDDLDDDNDGILDVDEMNCSNLIPINSPGYPLNTDFSGSSPLVDLAAFSTADIDLSYVLQGSATWNSGVRILNNAALNPDGRYVNLQPNNTNFQNGDVGVYTFDFNTPVTNLTFKWGGLDNGDITRFEAYSGGMPLIVNSSNITNLNIPAANFSFIETAAIMSTNGGANAPNNSVQFNIGGPVDSMVMTIGKNGANSANITLQLYEISYCLPIDSDNDGIYDHLDTDSDNDGCADAIEAGGSFDATDIDGNGMLTGGVDGNGIPNVVSPGGQANTTDVTDDMVNAGCNLPPVAGDDIGSTNEDTPLNGSTILSNDSDPDMDPLNLNTSPITGTFNGSLTINGDGTFMYTPNLHFNGIDSFSYEICDITSVEPQPLCDTATVVITVNPVNDPPIADNENVSTPEESPIAIDVLTGDFDIDGMIDPTSVDTTGLLQPSNGTLEINPITGVITYTPNPDFNGADVFEYSVCDDGSPVLCDIATVTVNVTPVNDAPIALGDMAGTNEDTPLNGTTVLFNDDDPDMDPLTVNTAPVLPPVNGMLTLNSDGTYIYTPNPNFNGVDSFHYEVCDVTIVDPQPLCDIATVIINVTPVNDPPVADDEMETTPEDTPIAIDVVLGDIDIDGMVDPTSVDTTGLLQPANGTLAIDPVTGEITYTPNLNFTGQDTFEYSICDDGTPVLCDTALVTVDVTPVNDPPVADDEMETTPEDTPITIDVVDGDVDIDGMIDPTSVDTTGLLQPSNGTLLIDPVTGEITYTPNLNFTGQDSFEYSICDDGTPILCDTALVTVDVTPVNDPPVADDEMETTPEDTPITIDVVDGDVDIDGMIDPTSVDTTGLLQPANGTLVIDPVTGEITYTPNLNYTGQDTFEYSICDDGTPALCDTALVTVDVTPVNDPPVADDEMETTPEDTPITIDVVDGDIDFDGMIDPTSVDTTGLLQPSNGTLAIDPVTGEITYTPDLNFTGQDTFEYSICDDGSPVLCDTATVTVDVTPVNDPPIAQDDMETTPEDTPILFNITDNDSDIDGNIDPATIDLDPTVIGNQSSLTITGQGTYTVNTANGDIYFEPAPNFNGMVNTVTYQVCDDGTPLPAMCTTADIDVTVTPVNDPPVADDEMETTPEDTPIAIDVVDGDVDIDGMIDPTSVDTTGLLQPSNGTLAIDPVTGEITYTPNLNFTGQDTFEYSICDDGTPILCDTALVTVDVTPVNDPPVADDEMETTPEDTPITIDVVDGDIDIDGMIDPTSVDTTGLLQPANGTLAIDPVTGEITYTPNLNFTGQDTFEYSICDDGTPILCDTALVTVDVTPVNDPPVADDEMETTPEDTPITIDVVDGDIDIDGMIDPTSVDTTGLLQPANGTLAIDPVTGEITYTPNLNFTGQDTFEYSICDDGTPILCDTALVTVDVTPVNDPPVADDEMETTPEDTPITIDVVDGDIDIDGMIDPTSVDTTGLLQPSNGTLAIDPVTGEITYTPNLNFTGQDTFEYSICDDGTPILCDTALVTVDVTPVNDPPVADDEMETTPEDTPITIDVVDGDIDIDGMIDPTSVDTTGLLQPANGTLAIDPVTGEITYTPNLNFTGQDTFEYSICDDGTPILCDTALVTVDVTPVNDPPVADDEMETTPEDTPITIDVVDGDIDIDGMIDPTSVDTTGLLQPANGTLAIDPVTGEITYTPNLNFTGQDTFEYSICDDGTPILCDTATVTVDVSPVNNPPVAINDDNNTLVDMPVGGSVATNDKDPDTGDNLTYSEVTGPSNGMITFNPDGTYIYTPNPGYSGQDTIVYNVCDDGIPGPLCDTAILVIDILDISPAANIPPVANDDDNITYMDTPVSGNVVGNDADPDGTILTVTTTPVSGPSNGMVTINTDGSYTYTPSLGFTGNDSFEYQVCDSGTPIECTTATVFIKVLPDLNGPANDPPFASDDFALTNQDVPVGGASLLNDYDINSDPIVINTTPITPPANGMLTINPDGTYNYVPNPGYQGPDQFVYEICETGTVELYCTRATVYLMVLPPVSLPITLTSFTGEDVNCSVYLQWETETEKENLQFEIERSFDGINFETIAIIPGAGTSLTPNYYQHVDESIQNLNYYRLKQVDFDGTYTYYNLVLPIRTECFDETITNGITDVYPNPIGDGVLTFQFYSGIGDGQAKMQVIDVLGRVLIEDILEYNEGDNMFKIWPNRLAAGVYYLHLIGEDWKTEPKEFIKLHQ